MNLLLDALVLGIAVIFGAKLCKRRSSDIYETDEPVPLPTEPPEESDEEYLREIRPVNADVGLARYCEIGYAPNNDIIERNQNKMDGVWIALLLGGALLAALLVTLILKASKTDRGSVVEPKTPETPEPPEKKTDPVDHGTHGKSDSKLRDNINNGNGGKEKPVPPDVVQLFVEEKSGPAKWACQYCGVENDAASAVCAVCHRRR